MFKIKQFALGGLTALAVLTFFIFQSPTQAGGFHSLYSSNDTVGETTTLTASFNGSSQCTNNKSFAVDGFIINADFLETSYATLSMANSNISIQINGETIPGSITTNYDTVLYWAPDAGELSMKKYDHATVVVDNVEITESNLIGFWFLFKNDGYETCHGFNYTIEPRDESDPASFFKRFGTVPTPTTIVTNTPYPTATPTNTPTPTPTPVPFDQIGLMPNVESVEITVARGGASTYAYELTSTGASQFNLYGYPTQYGPGINNNVGSGGIGSYPVTIRISANTNVPLGTYTGNQKVKGNDYTLYSILPITVHVVESLPSPTPTPTNVPTSTPSPTPTNTPSPTPVPELSIVNVHATNITRSSATVSWDTNVPGTSFVQYGTSTRRMNSYTSETASTRTDHSVALSNLSKGKTYYFRALSRDANGDLHVSAINSLKTPRK